MTLYKNDINSRNFKYPFIKGIRPLTDVIRNQLDSEDELQLDLLKYEGFTLIEKVKIIDYPDVEPIYRVIKF
jgi:hypothetical protein